MKIIGMILLIIVVLFYAIFVYACLYASSHVYKREEMGENKDWELFYQIPKKRKRKRF